MTICQESIKQYLSFYTVVVLMALFTSSLTAAELSGKQPWAVRFEIHLASLDKMEGWVSVPSDGQGPIWVSPEATLTNADVAEAQSGRTDDDRFCVNLLLTEDGALKLARLTKSHIGAFLVVMIDGRAASVPRIAAEILNGRARVDGNFTEEEAGSIAKGITAQQSPAGGNKK